MRLILLALLFRPNIRRPVRFIVTLIGISVGIASTISTLIGTRAAISAVTRDAGEISREVRYQVVSPGGIDSSDLTRFQPLTSNFIVLPVIEEFVFVSKLQDNVRLLGLDLIAERGARLSRLEIEETEVEGDFQKALLGEGAIFSKELLEDLDLGNAAQVEFLVDSEKAEVPIAASFVPDRFPSVWKRVVIMDLALAEHILKREGNLTRIDLVPRAPASLKQDVDRIEALLPGGYRVEAPEEQANESRRMIRALSFNLYALTGISLLVGAVLVATTLATSVVQRRFTFASLRSLGASSFQFALVMLLEATLIGFLGGILGAFFGWIGAYLSQDGVRATVAAVIQNLPAGDIRFYFTDLLLALGLGIGVSLLAGLLPMIESLTVPPIQHLRDENPITLSKAGYRYSIGFLVAFLAIACVCLSIPAYRGLPIPAVTSALFLFLALLASTTLAMGKVAETTRNVARWFRNTPFELAASGLISGRRRAAWAAGAIGVAFALAVSMGVMVDSFRQTVVDWSNQAMRADIWVRPVSAITGIPTGKLSTEITQELQNLLGQDSIDPFHQATVRFQGQPITLAAGAFDVLQEHGGIPFMDGREARQVFKEAIETNGVVINESLANRFQLNEGDTLEVETPMGTIEKPIVSVFYDYSRQAGLAVMNLPEFLPLFPNASPDGVAIFLPKDRDPEAVRSLIFERLGSDYRFEVMLNQDLRKEVVRAFNRTFAITRSMQAVASVVAVIAILTVLFALVGERKKELALLRNLGGSRFQVMGVVVGEATLLGLTGVLLGLTFGLAVGWILVKVVNLQSFGWTLQFLIPWPSLFSMILWSLPICALAGLAPAWKAGRTHPREALDEDRM